ncbi:MAG: YajQ family cyclic di-GMP-binding protein [Elusimicrobia bacterium]|nr:YajQ family cyclic di-GMP-binding protein [Elusimicrobiota bacterium]
MAQDFSFDVVSKVDPNLISECVQVAMKEISNRFDFKGSVSNIEFNQKDMALTVTSDDEFKLKNVLDILNTRIAKRGLPLKNFVPQKLEQALGGSVRQVLKVQNGIPTDKAKELVAAIKRAGIKVTASIQGDQVRVVSRSKDELQSTMTLLKGKDFGVDLQFGNYR